LVAGVGCARFRRLSWSSTAARCQRRSSSLRCGRSTLTPPVRWKCLAGAAERATCGAGGVRPGSRRGGRGRPGRARPGPVPALHHRTFDEPGPDASCLSPMARSRRGFCTCGAEGVTAQRRGNRPAAAATPSAASTSARPASTASSTAAAIFARTRTAPAAAASTSHASAPGPSARNAVSAGLVGLGVGGRGARTDLVGGRGSGTARSAGAPAWTGRGGRPQPGPTVAPAPRLDAAPTRPGRRRGPAGPRLGGPTPPCRPARAGWSSAPTRSGPSDRCSPTGSHPARPHTGPRATHAAADAPARAARPESRRSPGAAARSPRRRTRRTRPAAWPCPDRHRPVGLGGHQIGLRDPDRRLRAALGLGIERPHVATWIP